MTKNVFAVLQGASRWTCLTPSTSPTCRGTPEHLDILGPHQTVDTLAEAGGHDRPTKS